MEDDSSELSIDDVRSDGSGSQLVIDTADSLSRTFRYFPTRKFDTSSTSSFSTTKPRFRCHGSPVPSRRSWTWKTGHDCATGWFTRHLPRLGIVGIVDYDLTGDPHIWLSTNADIVDKDLLYDLVKRTYRYEQKLTRPRSGFKWFSHYINPDSVGLFPTR